MGGSPSLSTARAAPLLTLQNSARLRGRTAPDCGRRSSRQQPVRQAWTSVSVGRGRRQHAGGGPPAGQMSTGHPPAPAFPVYKVRLESMKSSTSNPYIYYNMKLEDIIKRGRSKGAEAAARGSTLGIPMCKRARPVYAHTLGLLSSRNRLCCVPHHEEICLSCHLPRLPGAARTGDIPHHGPHIGPVESQI